MPLMCSFYLESHILSLFYIYCVKIWWPVKERTTYFHMARGSGVEMQLLSSISPFINDFYQLLLLIFELSSCTTVYVGGFFMVSSVFWEVWWMVKPLFHWPFSTLKICISFIMWWDVSASLFLLSLSLLLCVSSTLRLSNLAFLFPAIVIFKVGMIFFY